jgi:hypothetical protein
VANLSDLIKSGGMPVGAVIAVMSNIAGATAIPASGTVVDGMMYCDGAAIPGGQVLSGSTPDLNGDTFLQGSSSAGSTGGSNTINLQHSHTVNSHTHSGPSHTHGAGSYDAAWAVGTSPDTTVMAWRTGSNKFTSTNYASNVLPSNTAISSLSSRNGIDVYGTSSADGTGNTGTASSNGTDNRLSTAQNNRPSYVSVQYLIRVK